MGGENFQRYKTPLVIGGTQSHVAWQQCQHTKPMYHLELHSSIISKIIILSVSTTSRMHKADKQRNATASQMVTTKTTRSNSSTEIGAIIRLMHMTSDRIIIYSIAKEAISYI